MVIQVNKEMLPLSKVHSTTKAGFSECACHFKTVTKLLSSFNIQDSLHHLEKWSGNTSTQKQIAHIKLSLWEHVLMLLYSNPVWMGKSCSIKPSSSLLGSQWGYSTMDFSNCPPAKLPTAKHIFCIYMQNPSLYTLHSLWKISNDRWCGKCPFIALDPSLIVLMKSASANIFYDLTN